MPREIKFRAWNNLTKEMGKVVALDWSKDSIITCHIEKDEEVRKYYPEKTYGDAIEFMQYTELKDKNGKEIYEGDIVEYELQEDSCWGDVGIYRDCIGFTEGEFVISYSDDPASLGDLLRFAGHKWVNVIGNIYENPELLEDRSCETCRWNFGDSAVETCQDCHGSNWEPREVEDK